MVAHAVAYHVNVEDGHLFSGALSSQALLVAARSAGVVASLGSGLGGASVADELGGVAAAAVVATVGKGASAGTENVAAVGK